MFIPIISGLLLVLYPVQGQRPWSGVCANICEQLPNDGKSSTCMKTCEILFDAQIGREVELPQTYYGSELGDIDYEPDVMKRGKQSGFVRIGRDTIRRVSKGSKKMKSNFLRIGRSADENNEVNANDWNNPFSSLGQRMYRMYNTPDNYKRTSNFVRIGKKSVGDAKRASGFVRIGRPSSFVRIGRDPSDDEKRASSFVRIGKSMEVPVEQEKRGSGFVRIGRPRLPSSGFVRIGKSHDEPTEKRASSFVRIGKSLDDPEEESKRAGSFVRIGKKSNDEESRAYADKRASSFVRIGKSQNIDDEKRASSFVRIGKSSDEPSIDSEKRTSTFVRIGKGLHQGGNDDDTIPLDEGVDFKRGSGFVRIGKRDAE